MFDYKMNIMSAMSHYTEMPENWKMVKLNPDILYFHILSQEKISTIQKFYTILQFSQILKFSNSQISTIHNPEHFQMCAGYKTTKLTSYKFLILTMCCI